MEAFFVGRCVLAALYLRGLARTFSPQTRGSGLVIRTLRLSDATLGSAHHVLSRAGLSAEAFTLTSPGLLATAEHLLLAGRCLTRECDGFPSRWEQTLGPGAPPALWIRGAMPTKPLFAVVGSRVATADSFQLASSVSAEASRQGFAIVSGGAIGSDQAALSSCEESAVILPHGLVVTRCPYPVVVSACAPEEPFSRPNAMERNALILASAEFSFVVHARIKEGGAWHAATSALRRRLTTLIVANKHNPAASALISLGGIPLSEASRLSALLELPPAQPTLTPA